MRSKSTWMKKVLVEHGCLKSLLLPKILRYLFLPFGGSMDSGIIKQFRNACTARAALKCEKHQFAVPQVCHISVLREIFSFSIWAVKILAKELSYGGYFILLSSIQLIKWASMFVTLHKQSQPASKNWRKKIIYFRTEVESPSKLQLRIISSWPIGIFRQIDQFFPTATSKQWFRG